MPHNNKNAFIVKTQWLAWFYVYSKCKLYVFPMKGWLLFSGVSLKCRKNDKNNFISLTN